MSPKTARHPSVPKKAGAAVPRSTSTPKRAPVTKARAKTSEPVPKTAAKSASPNVREQVDVEVSISTRKDGETAVAALASSAEEERAESDRKSELKRLASLADGEVTVKYVQYAEKFRIEGHRLASKTIDELYCLSDVMPGCFIHLSEREFAFNEEHSYVKEDLAGTFVGLMAGHTYWCYVQQDPEQEQRDQDMMRQKWADSTAEVNGLGNQGAESESCSCGFGAPCTNAMICKDWDNRYANAVRAGGNPMLFT